MCEKHSTAYIRGFLNGRRRPIHRNTSGCCCVIIDEQIIELCYLHRQLLEDAVEEVLKKAGETGAITG